MRRLAWLLGLAVLLTPRPAMAQGWDFGFGIGGGISFPVGDFGDVVGTGWHTGLVVEGRRMGTPLALRFAGDFHRFGLSDEAEAILGTEGDVDLWRWAAEAVWYFQASDVASPFLSAGLGAMNGDLSVSEDDGDLVGLQGDTRFTFSVGMGVMLPVTRSVGVAVEGRYVVATGDGTDPNLVPISVRVTF